MQLTQTKKICSRCRKAKLFSAFPNNPNTVDKLGIYCKQCVVEMARGNKLKKKNTDKYLSGESKINKIQAAKLFAFWQSIPAAVKDKDYLKKVKNVELTNEVEDVLPRLLKANSLKDVARVLGVSLPTVMSFKKNPKVNALTEKFDKWNNVMRFKKDVDYSFTQKTIKHADAARVKLWKQLFEGWVEKSGQVHELNEGNILGIQKQLRELAEKKNIENYGPQELRQELKIMGDGKTKLLKTASVSGGDDEEFGTE